MHEKRDNQTSLYMVPLKPEQNENMTEVKIPERHFSGSLYETKSKADICTFLHLALWSPCTSTLISAIKKTSSPHVQDSPNNSPKNSFKNPKQQQKGTFGNPTKEISQHILRNQMKRRVKIQLAHTIFFTSNQFSGKIYTDKTGRFPVTSSRGFKYTMVAYDHDSNKIHAKPMKNRSGPELLKSYTEIHNLLSKRGLAPKMHYLDNECPTVLQKFMTAKYERFQLVPPHHHR